MDDTNYKGASLSAKPVFELWLEEVVNKGLIEAPNFYENKAAWCRCKWIGPGRGWVDPVKEAQASQIRMESGLPLGILAENVNVTDEDKQAVVYSTGEFNLEALTYDSEFTAASITEKLREKSIFVKKTQA